jgi:ABC-type glycerol-3-phosphate transport system permease component
MNFLKYIFQTVSFTKYMPDTSFQALERGVKELIKESNGTFEYPIYFTVHCLIWIFLLLFKFVSSLKFGKKFISKKIPEKKKWSRDLQNSGNYIFSLNYNSFLKNKSLTTPPTTLPYFVECFSAFSRCFYRITRCQ